jgi:hypothetical protein
MSCPGREAWGATYRYEPEGQAGPVLARPFSATEVRRTMQILNDGTRVDHTEKGRFVRDAAGSMRMERYNLVILFDAVSNSVTELDPRSKTFRRMGSVGLGGSTYISIGSSGSFVMMADSGNRASFSMKGPPAVKEDLPPAAMNGVSVRGSRITTTIPRGTFGNDREVKAVNERWFSDDLHALIKSSNSDPRFGDTTFELTEIVQGAPDAALFQIPADYTAKK